MTSGTGNANFGARFAAMDATTDVLRAAAYAIDDLRDHPGVLRGRARDCGDDELAAAIQYLAVQWQWGLEVVGGEAARWAQFMHAVSATYRQAERTAFWNVHLPGPT